MKISEIIEPDKDLFDIVQHSCIVQINEIFDIVVDLTNNFYVPAGMLNEDAALEFLLVLSSIRAHLSATGDSLPEKWQYKIDRLFEYFS